MTSLALYQDFDLRRPAGSGPRSARARGRQGLLRRILAALERSHQRRVDEEAERFIAKHGGRITDDLERQLSEHFTGRGLPPFHL